MRHLEVISWQYLKSCLAILMVVASADATLAEPISIVNRLDRSKDHVLAVEQFCSKERGMELDGKFGFKSYNRLGEKFGSVNQYGLTTHNYSLSKSRPRGLMALYISYATIRLPNTNNCTALIVMKTDRARVRINSSWHDGNFQAHLDADELQEVEGLWRKCKDLGDRAPEFFHGGNYKIANNGEVLGIPHGFFHCKSAVPNNLSSVDIHIGRARFRLTVIYDKIYLQEIE